MQINHEKNDENHAIPLPASHRMPFFSAGCKITALAGKRNISDRTSPNVLLLFLDLPLFYVIFRHSHHIQKCGLFMWSIQFFFLFICCLVLEGERNYTHSCIAGEYMHVLLYHALLLKIIIRFNLNVQPLKNDKRSLQSPSNC